MSLKAKVEAIIYATEEPVTLDQLVSLLGDAVVAELRAEEAPANASETQPSFLEGQQPVDGLTKEQKSARDKAVKSRLAGVIEQLTAEYAAADRGMEIRQVAGGYRMATKPEHHDVVVTFAKSLKPPIRLSLQALETLSVIAYKQPVTVPEISEIRGVDSSGVIATLLDRKLITTAGRKQVIGRPILYKTTKEFLLRFGLNDVSELPSIEEFEKLGEPQTELFPAAASAGEQAAAQPVTEAANEPATAKEEKS
jgi:segregation and condensation protein B